MGLKPNYNYNEKLEQKQQNRRDPFAIVYGESFNSFHLNFHCSTNTNEKCCGSVVFAKLHGDEGVFSLVVMGDN